MKVIITSPSFGKFHDNISGEMENNGCTIIKLIPYCRDKMLKEVKDADAIIVGLEDINEEIIEHSNQLKVIAKHGVGVDNIDIEAATKRGISITNTPGTNNDAVADLAFGLMLSIARSIPEANSKLKLGEWNRYDGYSVWGKTIGIVGLGAIGLGLAKRANGFNMKILAYDITEPNPMEKDLNIERVTLDELISNADYISLHVPLNKYTHGMIGEIELSKMKKTAFLINTARGGLINEQALFNSLTNQEIMGCAIDVFEVEPPAYGSIPQLDNLIVTPHMAAYTVESGRLTSEVTKNNVLGLITGTRFKNVVNSRELLHSS